MRLAPFAIPKGAFVILKEILRHVLRRPVVGIAAIAKTRDGRMLLIRRGDTGEWAFVGGTLEWGESLRVALIRELAEEAGVDRAEIGKIIGVFSKPERDPRFHAVTVLVECVVDEPVRPPVNPLEIREVGLFEPKDLPRELSMGMTDMLHAGIRGEQVPIE